MELVVDDNPNNSDDNNEDEDDNKNKNKMLIESDLPYEVTHLVALAPHLLPA